MHIHHRGGANLDDPTTTSLAIVSGVRSQSVRTATGRLIKSGASYSAPALISASTSDLPSRSGLITSTPAT